MTIEDFLPMLAFTRARVEELAEAIAATGRAAEVLAWRPGPGRANLGWQLLHLAATDHRFATLRLQGVPATETDLVKGFGFGSTPADVPPSLDTIRAALTKQRGTLTALIGRLASANPEDYPPPPPPGMPVPPPRTYGEWLTLLVWHEGHHHGQAHLTFNLWKAAHSS